MYLDGGNHHSDDSDVGGSSTEMLDGVEAQKNHVETEVEVLEGVIAVAVNVDQIRAIEERRQHRGGGVDQETLRVDGADSTELLGDVPVGT